MSSKSTASTIPWGNTSPSANMNGKVEDSKSDNQLERDDSSGDETNKKTNIESLTHKTISNHDQRLPPSNSMVRPGILKAKIVVGSEVGSEAGSEDGSVGGIFGGSEGESDEDSLVFDKGGKIEITLDNLNSLPVQKLDTKDDFSSRKSEENFITRLENPTFDTRSEADIPVTPKMLVPRRQCSYRSIRSVSLHSQASEKEVDVKSEKELVIVNKYDENVRSQRFISRPPLPLPTSTSTRKKKEEIVYPISPKTPPAVELYKKNLIGEIEYAEEKVSPASELYNNNYKGKKGSTGEKKFLLPKAYESQTMKNNITSQKSIRSLPYLGIEELVKKNGISGESKASLNFKHLAKATEENAFTEGSEESSDISPHLEGKNIDIKETIAAPQVSKNDLTGESDTTSEFQSKSGKTDESIEELTRTMIMKVDKAAESKKVMQDSTQSMRKKGDKGKGSIENSQDVESENPMINIEIEEKQDAESSNTSSHFKIPAQVSNVKNPGEQPTLCKAKLPSLEESALSQPTLKDPPSENNTVERPSIPLHLQLKSSKSDVTVRVSNVGKSISQLEIGGKASYYDVTSSRDEKNSERDSLISTETHCAPSFSQFGLLQIHPEQLLLLGDDYIFADDGPSHIDCFIRNLDVGFSDHFTVDAGKPLDSASVGSLCFPDGLRVRYIPRAGLEGAKRMGFIGSKGDTSHVMVFTNARGETEHGVAITIQWEINLRKHERQALSEIVYKRRKRRRAARKIQKCWRNSFQKKILAEALNISGFKGLPTDDLKAGLAPGELVLLEKALKNKEEQKMTSKKNGKKSPNGNGIRKPLRKRSLNKKIKKVLNRSKSNDLKGDTSEIKAMTRAAVMRSTSLSCSTSHSNSTTYSNGASMSTSNTGSRDSSDDAESFLVPKDKSPLLRRSSFPGVRSVFQNRTAVLSTISVPNVEPSMRMKRHLSSNCERLGRESYKTMKKNDRLGSVCIVQKCYTLIGCQPDEHVILLASLQQLINSERREILSFRESKAEANQRRRPKSATADEERRIEWEMKRQRRNILRAMHVKLRLTTRQALVSHPRNQLDYIMGRWNYFDWTIPEIPGCETIMLPLPLPRIGKEWALAQFLLDIGPDSLLLCLKLMLLERSILVLGDNLNIVSTTACALIELLKPFEWASAFMPVLPPRMLDFITSPVPFIAGVSVRDVYAIENDKRVIEAMTNGMSLLNLKTRTVHITAEKGINKMISLDLYLLEKLKFLRSRLQTYVNESHLNGTPQSALRNFNAFLKCGLSPQESLTLHAAVEAIEKHFSFFCGDLIRNGKAWKRYGTIDVKTNEFIYNPEWFLNPMKADQAFQEALCNTQLFSGFVHEKRLDQIEKQEMMEGELGHYVANWIYEKWKQRRARHRYEF